MHAGRAVNWSDVTDEALHTCLLSRARRVARVITAIYDQELRPHGINAPRFSLLVLISRLDGATRAKIGRTNNQERSTLSRNLHLLLQHGWVTETTGAGRNKPIVVSPAGYRLLDRAAPAWRAAQVRTRQLLGREGVAAVMKIADDLASQ
jgi:DNA-binding MarR family transcriptional regulator